MLVEPASPRRHRDAMKPMTATTTNRTVVMTSSVMWSVVIAQRPFSAPAPLRRVRVRR